MPSTEIATTMLLGSAASVPLYEQSKLFVYKLSEQKFWVKRQWSVKYKFWERGICEIKNAKFTWSCNMHAMKILVYPLMGFLQYLECV